MENPYGDHSFAQFIALGVPLGLNAALCLLDERQLKRAGYDDSWLTLFGILLAPAYLFLRAKRLRQFPSYGIAWEALGMGTTLVGAVLRTDQLVTFNLGDSRSYLFSAGQLVQLSRDDVPEGASDHFGRRRTHALTQALGGSFLPMAIEPHVTIDAPLAAGETLLLCSDGLTDMVPDQIIREMLKTGNDPDRTTRKLVAKAFSAGAEDNISLIVARRVNAPAAS